MNMEEKKQHIIKKRKELTKEATKNKDTGSYIWDLHSLTVSEFVEAVKTEQDYMDFFKTMDEKTNDILSTILHDKQSTDMFYSQVYDKNKNVFPFIANAISDDSDLFTFFTKKFWKYSNETFKEEGFLETNKQIILDSVINKTKLIIKTQKKLSKLEEGNKDKTILKTRIMYNQNGLSKFLETLNNENNDISKKLFEDIWYSLNVEEQQCIIQNMDINQDFYELISNLNDYENNNRSFFKDYGVMQKRTDVREQAILESKLTSTEYKKLKNNLPQAFIVSEYAKRNKETNILEGLSKELSTLEIIPKEHTMQGVELLYLMSSECKEELLFEEKELDQITRHTGNVGIFKELYQADIIKLDKDLIDLMYPKQEEGVYPTFISNHNILIDLKEMLLNKTDNKKIIESLKNLNTSEITKIMKDLLEDSNNKEMLEFFLENKKFFKELIEVSGASFQEYFLVNFNTINKKDEVKGAIELKDTVSKDFIESINQGNIKLKDLNVDTHRDSIKATLRVELKEDKYKEYLQLIGISRLDIEELSSLFKLCSDSEITELLKTKEKIFNTSSTAIKIIQNTSPEHEIRFLKLLFNDLELIDDINSEKGILSESNIESFNKVVYYSIQDNGIAFEELKHLSLRNLYKKSNEYKEIIGKLSVSDMLKSKTNKKSKNLGK